jgi:hypothetical protein
MRRPRRRTAGLPPPARRLTEGRRLSDHRARVTSRIPLARRRPSAASWRVTFLSGGRNQKSGAASNNGRGGPRPGSGPKPTPLREHRRNRVTINLTDDELRARRGGEVVERLRARRSAHAPAAREVEADMTRGSPKYWSGRRDSNSRPPDPQSGALTRLRYGPNRALG